MSPHLTRAFFARDTRIVARDMLGTRLVRLMPDGTRLSGIIVETEAYRPGDRASHAYRGRTERNFAMFLRPGTSYIYFIYGAYYCLNIVTEKVDVPAAVLIRALEPQDGIDIMQRNRAGARASTKTVKLRNLCRGPGRLCQAMGIDLRYNAYDMVQPGSQLYIEQGIAYSDEQIRQSPRVGVFGDKTAITAEWRWFVSDSMFVSPRARNHPTPKSNL